MEGHFVSLSFFLSFVRSLNRPLSSSPFLFGELKDPSLGVASTFKACETLRFYVESGVSATLSLFSSYSRIPGVLKIRVDAKGILLTFPEKIALNCRLIIITRDHCCPIQM